MLQRRTQTSRLAHLPLFPSCWPASFSDSSSWGISGLAMLSLTPTSPLLLSSLPSQCSESSLMGHLGHPLPLRGLSVPLSPKESWAEGSNWEILREASWGRVGVQGGTDAEWGWGGGVPREGASFLSVEH